MTMTWQNGRELAALTKDGKTISYSYNADGIRTEKSNDGVVTKYFYDSNNNLISLICGDIQLVFYYDADGQADSFTVYSGNTATRYYYVKNLQGDITKIMTADGAVVANYYYSAYGEILSITDADGDQITDASSVAFLNPLRYRGYMYDDDTGLYYLRSRFYDSTTGRFINLDAGVDSRNVVGSNLFVYCYNSPINMHDPTGYYTGALVLSSGVIASLSGALAGLMTSVSASMVSLKAAIATSWYIPVCIAATAIAIVGIVYAVNRVNALMNTASKTISAVKSKVKSGGLNPKKLSGYTVYVIVRKGTTDVVYVGITKNYSSRKSNHTKKRFPTSKFTMMPIATGLSKAKARALEQTLITAYGIDTLQNMINSISPKKWNNFKTEFNQIGTLIQSWIDPE